MITLNISFNYEDELYKLKACLKNDMTLSNSKQNQATELIEGFRRIQGCNVAAHIVP